MLSDCVEPGRRNMTISVTVLGVALMTVLMAYLVFGDNNDQEGLATLRLIGVVFRHGNRSPTELYPNDPHINYEWPGGLGSLSDKGFLETLNLGKNLKMRYYKLFPPNGRYTKDNMFVVSSAAERCIMSAASFMAGLLPPLDNRNVLPIPWQPVPINSIARDTDQNVTNVYDVEMLYNTLEIEQNAGLVLPEWTDDVFPDKMLPLAERSLALLRVKIVYYFNNEDKFPKEISIPECKSPCSLTEFTRVMDKVTLRKYDMICKSV